MSKRTFVGYVVRTPGLNYVSGPYAGRLSITSRQPQPMPRQAALRLLADWLDDDSDVGGKLVKVFRTSHSSSIPSMTIHECRCCGDANRGYNDGTFGHDARGPWRRIAGIDGPNAICPMCAADDTSLTHLVCDGYEPRIV